jgi:hypothetical protein
MHKCLRPPAVEESNYEWRAETRAKEASRLSSERQPFLYFSFLPLLDSLV